MQTLQQFLAYAGAFEKTLGDDDWERLRPFFADDAVYEVEAQSFGCRLQGATAIFAGMKKSLDGFDRKFDGRDVKLTEGPAVEGDEIRMRWEVIYRKQGVEPFTLRGRSLVRYGNGKLVYLCDSYEPSTEAEFTQWSQVNKLQLDPRYT